MNEFTKALVVACALASTLPAGAQDVPSTAQATGGGTLNDPSAIGRVGVQALSASKRPETVDRTVVKARDSLSSATVTWTNEYSPSAQEWERQVAESIAARQSFGNHDATRTLKTQVEGQEIVERTITPSEEAYGRLHDPMPQVGIGDTFDGSYEVPSLNDEGLQRTQEPWSVEHGFGLGRAD